MKKAGTDEMQFLLFWNGKTAAGNHPSCGGFVL